jgi:hypothetical protein
MNFTFSPHIPADYLGMPELISGQNPIVYNWDEYLLVEDKRKNVTIYRINYETHCGPFKQAAIDGNLLLVGHEEHFYLYDLVSKQNIVALSMSGYFSNFYIQNEYFYVSDAGSLFCLNKKGNVIWKNANLGIDGVIVEKFTEEEIHGSGEWDPPGGWVDFKLDLRTGKKIGEQ